MSSISKKTINEFKIFAAKLADASSDIVKKYYRGDINTKSKKDKSLITVVDTEVETKIRNIISATYPDHGIIGEEFDSINVNADFKWIIDPIDGTNSFVIGRPIFGTLISLIHKDKAILGIIEQAIVKDRWIGVANEAATLNGQIIKTSKVTKIKDSVMAATSPKYLGEIGFKITNQCKQLVYGGDCYSYGLLAAGTIDAIVETDLNVYDYAALVPIIEAAGGIITNWEGEALAFKGKENVIAAANNKLHEQILKEIHG